MADHLTHAPAPTHSPPGELSRVPYMPGLDGMRALAVVAVIFYHANHEWLDGGFIGVEIFFIISGYLITLLLLGEHERNGHIDLRQFWIRRFRRLLPALITMLALLAIYIAAFYPRARGRTRGDFLAGFPFYSSNWYQIWAGQGYGAQEAFAPLRHLWSLAVEEQFYLLWPLVMTLLLRRRRQSDQPRLALWFWGIALFIAALTASLFAGGDVAAECSPDRMNGYWKLFGRCISINDTLYLSSITRASGILLGAGLAMVWRPMAILRGPLRDRARRLDVIALVGLVALGFMTWKMALQTGGHRFGSRYDPWLFRGGFLMVGIATIAVVLAVTHRDALTGKVLGHPILNWIGTRSYGLYLYHWPIYQIIRKEAGIALSPAKFVFALILTVPITEASYRWIETPIRKGRMREMLGVLRGERRTVMASVSVVAVLAVAVLSMAVAPNHCVGDIECSLEANAQVDDDTTQPPVSVPPTDPSTPGGVTTDPPTSDPSAVSTSSTSSTTTTTAPAAAKPYATIGESVMAGAVAPLRSGGGVVDAKENRGANGTLDALRSHLASGEIGPDTPVVIQVGSNGEVTADEYDQMMALLPTQRVVFMTVRAPKAAWIAGNNERIRALPGRYPNVSILDWATRSNDVKLCPDGTHISCDAGALRQYANMIFESIGRPDLVKN